MLAPGNYVQWKSRIKRYIDTKPNSELIHYSLQNPPYIYQWAEKTVPAAEGSSKTTTERYMENYKNVSQDIRDQLNAEAKPFSSFYWNMLLVTEDEEMSKEKEIDKLMALISLSTNKGTGYDNQRAINVVGARENVGTPVVQKSGIQCYNCKEYGHVSRECQKPKRVKDAAYHKEKMLLCKQEEVGVQLNAEQADWKDDTDDESDDQELEAHYMYMA
ncbi:integrase, catalytic region, zinc finger, CCHC-type containing protein [Tanacetum coccineum]